MATKLEGKWVEIFRGGKQKDMHGKEHDGNAFVEAAIKSFDRAKHEPPVVIGHPKTDAPAFAWVSGLRAVDKGNARVLEAQFAQVQENFADMVEKGLFKKRSAAFYKDGSLRHVGFLGAMPPAVKGLENIAFANEEKDLVSFEFAEEASLIARMFRKIREWIIAKEGMETADEVLSSWSIEDLERMAREPAQAALEYAESATNNKEEGMPIFKKQQDEKPEAPPAAYFSEAEVTEREKAAAQKAAIEAREAVAAEFAEQARKDKEAQAKAKIVEFVETGITEGFIAPAWKKAGLVPFMEGLEAADTVAFAEGDANKKTPLEFFQGFLKGLPKVVNFAEVAGGDPNTPAHATAGDKLARLTADKLKADKNLTYAAAFAEVQTENPDLAAEYAQDIGA